MKELLDRLQAANPEAYRKYLNECSGWDLDRIHLLFLVEYWEEHK